MTQTTILPGRFQPPHNDHVELVRRVAQIVSQPFYLGLIVHAPGVPPRPRTPRWFDQEARRQNLPERTPFTMAQRMSMWSAIFEHELDGIPRPAVIGLPRPEAAWEWITAMFPGPRTWVVPRCGEPFDDMKAAFFQRQGDQVIRPRLEPRTDGRVVRAALHDPDELRRHVPPSVAAWVEENLIPSQKEQECP